MHILVANIPLPGNRFIVDLNNAISTAHLINQDPDVFWDMNNEGNFDIVHLHFPEYLTFALQDAYKSTLTNELIAKTTERLRWWSERARIVVTRHVLLPHDALKNPMWEKMYETVYAHADGVAHFARASIDEFRQRYAHTQFIRSREPIHSIIPHQNYASLPNTITQQQARSSLAIPPDAKVMLVFGAIRNDAERQLILDTFNRIKHPKKFLLVSRWREKLAKVSWIRLKYWIRDLKRLYYRLNPRTHFNYAFVEEEDTQIYLNAADVLFIPRFKVLNSGNVTLGMTFGKIVVGPDSWDVGELLRETGNPAFDPDHPETAAAAMEEAFRLADTPLGDQNMKRALSDWAVEKCAARYIELYKTPLENDEYQVV